MESPQAGATRGDHVNRRSRAIVHLSLGLGMLAVVVAAGLSPNTGIVQASSNCTYGQCPASSPPFPLWAVGASVAAVVVALLLAFLILRRRRRPGQPPSEWEGPPGAGGGPAGGAPPYEDAAFAGAAAGTAAAATPMWQEPPPPEAEPGAAPTADYLEPSTPPEPEPAPTIAPEPVPAPMPAPIPAPSLPPVGGKPPPTPPAATDEAEPDIDSLMAELEKISGEILKQKPKKKPGTGSPPADDDAP
jgi:hypothetical protein